MVWKFALGFAPIWFHLKKLWSFTFRLQSSTCHNICASICWWHPSHMIIIYVASQTYYQITWEVCSYGARNSLIFSRHWSTLPRLQSYDINTNHVIKDLLSKVNMTETNCVNTPMFNTFKISKLANPFLYQSAMGTLQYVTLTRPYIEYCINKACQYMADPLESHWGIVKYIRYIRSTITYRIVLAPASSMQRLPLWANNDSEWASDPNDRQSTSEWIS